MKRVRQRDTAAEMIVRRALHRMGLRYRVNLRVLPGFRRTVDIAFTKRKVAVFVDGCFWHGCPLHATSSKSNQEYWSSKIAANVARDRDTDEALGQAGWTAVRIWEHEPSHQAAARVYAAVVGTTAEATDRRGRPSRG